MTPATWRHQKDLKILTDKKHLEMKLSSVYEKREYGHLSSWDIKPTLYEKFLNWNKIFKKIK